MQIAANQLTHHLGRGFKNLYTVHGDEPLLAQEALDAIRAHARTLGFTERTVHTVAGAHFDWSAVLAAGASLSLFADKQIVELRIPSGKPGKDGSVALQELAQLAAGNADTLTLVVLPRLDKMTKSSAWFAALEGHGITLGVEPVERNALPQWIAQRLALERLRVADGEEGQRTLQFFADRVEGNLLAAHQEIRKLALLYIAPTLPAVRGSLPSEGALAPQGGPSALDIASTLPAARGSLPPEEATPLPGGAMTTLSFDQVESAVLNVARYDVYKLAEAVLAGQPQRVQRMLEGLRAEGEAEVLVHWALSEDIRVLKRIKDAMGQGRPLPMALREQRVWGVKERLFERVLPRLTDQQVARLLQGAHVVDGIVKGLKQPGWPTQPWAALHQLAMQVCRACMPRAGQT